MHYLVYKITNLLDNKYYIGVHKTKNIDDGYMGSGKYLKYAIKKHGIENFKKEILFECSSSEEMFEKEKELVEISEKSYNLKNGGFGGWDHIKKDHHTHKTEHMRKMGLKGGKSCYEKKTGIHDPTFIRPPQKKLVSDEELISAYRKEKNVNRALLSLGLSRNGGSRRRIERLIASLDQLE